jgi:predicted amidohydrolase YtcJ
MPSALITRLIVNARVATGDPGRPWADAIAIAGDVVERIGSSAELRKLIPEGTPVIDAKGALVADGATLTPGAPADFTLGAGPLP